MDLLEKYEINTNDIECVNIYLDDNVPDYMEGILRIGSVIIYTKEKEFDIQELVDNSEFISKRSIENFVNKILGTTIANVIE